MPSIIEQAILAAIQQIISLLLGIVVGQQTQALDRSQYGISDDVADLHAIAHNPTYGAAALQSELATFQATTALNFTAVLTAIAATQQTGSPVTLPTVYPGGWSTQLRADASNGVWNTPDAYTGATTLGDLSNLALVAGNLGTFATNPGDNDRPFHWIGNIFQSVPYPLVRTFGAEFPAEQILSTDTLLTFLNTANPGWTWTWDDAGHNWASALDPANAGVTWYCDVDTIAFERMKAEIFPPAASAPIWPGLAAVTLGTPVALSDGLLVAGPLQGVLVDITAVPTPISYYPFGTIKSFVRAGAICFTTDNGQSEFPEPFGPDSQIILPRTMSQAASASVRLASGIVGTITPFTIP
jgi:hypothetical protein